MISWMATILAFVGNWLLIYGHRHGWLCWIISNLLLIRQAMMMGAWNLVIQFAVFEVLAIYGWWKWGGQRR